MKVKTLEIESTKKINIYEEELNVERVGDCLRITADGKIRDIKIKELLKIIGEDNE